MFPCCCIRSRKLDESLLDDSLKFTPVHLTADTRGETSLHSAVRFGHVSVVELLLNHDEQFRSDEVQLMLFRQWAIFPLLYSCFRAGATQSMACP